MDLKNKQQSNDNKHNEKNSGRIHSDADDLRKIGTTSGKSIHLMEVDSRLSNVLVNICTGGEPNQFVNLNKVTKLETKKMEQSIQEWTK